MSEWRCGILAKVGQRLRVDSDFSVDIGNTENNSQELDRTCVAVMKKFQGRSVPAPMKKKIR